MHRVQHHAGQPAGLAHLLGELSQRVAVTLRDPPTDGERFGYVGIIRRKEDAFRSLHDEQVVSSL